MAQALDAMSYAYAGQSRGSSVPYPQIMCGLSLRGAEGEAAIQKKGWIASLRWQWRIKTS
jgi:hypothetical protein